MHETRDGDARVATALGERDVDLGFPFGHERSVRLDRAVEHTGLQCGEFRGIEALGGERQIEGAGGVECDAARAGERPAGCARLKPRHVETAIGIGRRKRNRERCLRDVALDDLARAIDIGAERATKPRLDQCRM